MEIVWGSPGLSGFQDIDCDQSFLQHYLKDSKVPPMQVQFHEYSLGVGQNNSRSPSVAVRPVGVFIPLKAGNNYLTPPDNPGNKKVAGFVGGRSYI